MDQYKLRELIARSESELLDFKGSVGYDFSDDKKKGAFVKDVIAMSNSLNPNSDAAYILLGVTQDPQTGRGIAEGFIPNPNFNDDAKLQEFFLGKSNKRPKFNYEIIEIDVNGLPINIGVITIHYAGRPIFLTNHTRQSNHWGVELNTAWFRQGTRTAAPSPQEIWDWAIKDEKIQLEKLTIKLLQAQHTPRANLRKISGVTGEQDCYIWKFQVVNIGPCPWTISAITANLECDFQTIDKNLIRFSFDGIRSFLHQEECQITIRVQARNIDPKKCTGQFLVSLISDIGLEGECIGEIKEKIK